MTQTQKLSREEQEKLDDRLIRAAEQNNTQEVQALLTAGANVHAGGDCALLWASGNGHAETMKVLFAGGADVHANDDLALRSAAESGDAETVQVLLAAGANVHAVNNWALCWASFWGHTETLKILLAAGANVHGSNDRALCWAAGSSDAETVQVLAAHIFGPESWRGKSRTEIEAEARALYEKIKGSNIPPEDLHKLATILADCALTCWEQVRPAPPKLQISPLPAKPRPL
jgi:hypothetical protein